MNNWLFLILFLSAGVALNLFLRYAWPQLRKSAAGDRKDWALTNSYSIEPGDAFLESIGRPGLFSSPDSQAGHVLRGPRVTLVDFSFLVKHTGDNRDSWTEPRLVTVAVGDLAREVPALRVAPRTLSVRITEIAAFSPVPTGDSEFDRAFHAGLGQLGGLGGKLTAGNVREALTQIAPDADAVRAVLTKPVRATMQKYPRCTFEFQGRFLLIYEQWRLWPDRRLLELEKIWSEISDALRPDHRTETRSE